MKKNSHVFGEWHSGRNASFEMIIKDDTKVDYQTSLRCFWVQSSCTSVKITSNPNKSCHMHSNEPTNAFEP